MALYLGLYSWNRRTGHLDSLANHTGLEFTRWILKPGDTVADRVRGFWERYVYLVAVRQENETLKERLREAETELANLRERAAEAERLSRLLAFSPPEEWLIEGARVVSQRLGPGSALETILVDKGSSSGFGTSTPVVTPEGVVGRILRASPHSATVLLITDLNSGIAILGQSTRSAGILTGQGEGKPLRVQYVPQNTPLEAGEILVTSGTDGIFPKGLPVAKVTVAERSKFSLFMNVEATPLAPLHDLEDILMLKRAPKPEPESAPASSPPPPPVARPGHGDRKKK